MSPGLLSFFLKRKNTLMTSYVLQWNADRGKFQIALGGGDDPPIYSAVTVAIGMGSLV
jgi:hypothetical protein